MPAPKKRLEETPEQTTAHAHAQAQTAAQAALRQTRAERIDATPLSPRERIGRIGAGIAGLVTTMLWAHFMRPGDLVEMIPLSLLCGLSAMMAASPLTTEATFVRERVTRGERTVTKVIGVAAVLAVTLYWISDLGRAGDQSFLSSALAAIG